MRARLRPATAPFLLTSALLCGCADSRRHDDTAALRKQAAQEIARICALPAAEREHEIARVKTEAGMTVVCQKK